MSCTEFWKIFLHQLKNLSLIQIFLCIQILLSCYPKQICHFYLMIKFCSMISFMGSIISVISCCFSLTFLIPHYLVLRQHHLIVRNIHCRPNQYYRFKKIFLSKISKLTKNVSSCTFITLVCYSNDGHGPERTLFTYSRVLIQV